MSCYKLLLVLILGDDSPPKDSGDSLGGVLVGRALAIVLSSALAIFSLIVIAPLPFH